MGEEESGLGGMSPWGPGEGLRVTAVRCGAVLVAAMLCGAAYANPVIGPGYTLAQTAYFGIVASALVLEVIIVTACLFAVGMRPYRLFPVLLMANVVTFAAIILTGVDVGAPVIVMETAVVMVELLIVKFVAFIPLFRRDGFVKLRWRYALGVVVAGNVASYLLGLTVSYPRIYV